MNPLRAERDATRAQRRRATTGCSHAASPAAPITGHVYEGCGNGGPALEVRTRSTSVALRPAPARRLAAGIGRRTCLGRRFSSAAASFASATTAATDVGADALCRGVRLGGLAGRRWRRERRDRCGGRRAASGSPCGSARRALDGFRLERLGRRIMQLRVRIEYARATAAPNLAIGLFQRLVGDTERRVAFGAAREQHGGRLARDAAILAVLACR